MCTRWVKAYVMLIEIFELCIERERVWEKMENMDQWLLELHEVFLNY